MVSICFLFTQHLQDNSCLCLKLDQQGQIDAPLAQRSIDDIRALQKNARTYIVAPGQRFSFHELELPWLADKKARAAIPYALEDRLAQPVDSLHFAFANNYYRDGKYLVVVSENDYLDDLIARLDAFEISFDLLTVDWFALLTNEIALADALLLINDEQFKGALSPELAAFYLPGLTEARCILSFSDSDISLASASKVRVISHEESSYHWLAQRLAQAKPMNLCQGKLQHGSNHIKTKRLYQVALGMCMVWLLSIVTVNAIKIHYLNKDLNVLDSKIAVIYHEFFPQATQVISPKFRLSQLIKTNQNNAETTFWRLLDNLAKQTKSSPVSIEQLRFQNQTLLVTLVTQNFENLEDFQAGLQQNKVKVKQTQASTRNQQVVSTLELNL